MNDTNNNNKDNSVDSSALRLEETFEISISTGGTASKESKHPALCRIDWLDNITTKTDGDENVQQRDDDDDAATPTSAALALRIHVLAAMGNQIYCWKQSFSANELLREWKLDSSSSSPSSSTAETRGDFHEKKDQVCNTRQLIWSKIRQYLSLDDDSNSSSTAAASTTSSKMMMEQGQNQKTMISTEWTLEGPMAHAAVDDGNYETQLQTATKPKHHNLILHVKQGRKGLLMRNLWKAEFNANSVSNPSQSFRDVVISGMLGQMRQQVQAYHVVRQKCRESETAVDDWKQTAHTLEQGWHREKGPLVQNFLTLYNSQQDHIQELEQRIKKLEQELSRYTHNVDDENDIDLKRKRQLLLQKGAPDDDEMEVDRLIAQENETTARGRRKTTITSNHNIQPQSEVQPFRATSTATVADTTANYSKKRRNPVTGAIEYLDESALFADKTLFGSDVEKGSDDDEDEDDDKERRRARASANNRPSRKRAAGKPSSVDENEQTDDSATMDDKDDDDDKQPATKTKRPVTSSSQQSRSRRKTKKQLKSIDDKDDNDDDEDSNNGNYTKMKNKKAKINKRDDDDDSATDDEADYIDHDMRQDMLAQLAAMKGK